MASAMDLTTDLMLSDSQGEGEREIQRDMEKDMDERDDKREILGQKAGYGEKLWPTQR